MTLRRQNSASVKRTVSEATEALITAKCQLNDTYSLILNAVEKIYGDTHSDMYSAEIFERLEAIHQYVDDAVLNSIYENICDLDRAEF